MAYILHLETTTTNCSVSLSKDGELVILQEDMGANYSHAERLHPFISKVLTDAKIAFNQLDAVAVSSGPGSYTGLRIGVSSAKGLCYAHNVPLIAVDTLQHLAQQAAVKYQADFYIPLLDARRMEVYSAVFNKKLTSIRETRAEIITGDLYNEYLDQGNTVFIGNGVEKFQEQCNHPNAIFLPKALPSAREMIPFANAKYKKGDFVDVAYFEPYYLKDFLVTKPKKK
ncbi:MAG: tRNA (adenosine(37)-N6)-threonylcarbamoyltransferase complex dimerization subunit type 1 TsaB [Leeuwenhoekiella sp.]